LLASKSSKADLASMQLLREKFVSQAFKYLGTPYTKKVYKEGDDHYYSPIFLDCCGLVRQCVNDLSEDFGFSLSKYNQGYQFDILPFEIPKEEAKRGDLVFYTATYVKEQKVLSCIRSSGNLSLMI